MENNKSCIQKEYQSDSWLIFIPPNIRPLAHMLIYLSMRIIIFYIFFSTFWYMVVANEVNIANDRIKDMIPSITLNGDSILNIFYRDFDSFSNSIILSLLKFKIRSFLFRLFKTLWSFLDILVWLLAYFS